MRTTERDSGEAWNHSPTLQDARGWNPGSPPGKLYVSGAGGRRLAGGGGKACQCAIFAFLILGAENRVGDLRGIDS